jgi:hypothetical protein
LGWKGGIPSSRRAGPPGSLLLLHAPRVCDVGHFPMGACGCRSLGERRPFSHSARLGVWLAALALAPTRTTTSVSRSTLGPMAGKEARCRFQLHEVRASAAVRHMTVRDATFSTLCEIWASVAAGATICCWLHLCILRPFKGEGIRGVALEKGKRVSRSRTSPPCAGLTRSTSLSQVTAGMLQEQMSPGYSWLYRQLHLQVKRHLVQHQPQGSRPLRREDERV